MAPTTRARAAQMQVAEILPVSDLREESPNLEQSEFEEHLEEQAPEDEPKSPSWTQIYKTEPPCMALDLPDGPFTYPRPGDSYTKYEKPEPAGWRERLDDLEVHGIVFPKAKECLKSEPMTLEQMKIIYKESKPLAEADWDMSFSDEQKPFAQFRTNVVSKVWPDDAQDFLRDFDISIKILTKSYRPTLEKTDKRHPLGPMKAQIEAWTKEGKRAAIHHFEFHKGRLASEPAVSSETTGRIRKHFEAVRKYLESTAFVQQIASMCFEHLQPERFRKYRARSQQLMQENPKFADVSISNRAFATMQAVVVMHNVAPHRDDNDYKEGPAVTMVFGDFEGGLVCLPELKHPKTGDPICFRQKPGDILILDAPRVQHYVTDVDSGHRAAVVFASKQHMMEDTIVGEKMTCPYCPAVFARRSLAHQMWEKVDPTRLRNSGPDGIHDPLRCKFEEGSKMKVTKLRNWAEALRSGKLEANADPDIEAKLQGWAERLLAPVVAPKPWSRKRKAAALDEGEVLESEKEPDGQEVSEA